jgi:hypothetical protein
MPFSALPGGEGAGEATDAPEVEGFGDEEDAAQRRWCTHCGTGFRGKRAYDSKGNEKEEEACEDCLGTKLITMKQQKCHCERSEAICPLVTQCREIGGVVCPMVKAV